MLALELVAFDVLVKCCVGGSGSWKTWDEDDVWREGGQVGRSWRQISVARRIHGDCL